MMRVRRLAPLVLVGLGAVLVTGSPAGAQQLVDAAGHRGGGGLAFVLMTVMVMVIVGSMFFMDKVRRRASERDEPTSSN